MENLKYLKIKIKVKGLVELRDKLDILSYDLMMLKNNMKSINRLIKEINQMELVVDVDRDRKGGLYGKSYW